MEKKSKTNEVKLFEQLNSLKKSYSYIRDLITFVDLSSNQLNKEKKEQLKFLLKTYKDQKALSEEVFVNTFLDKSGRESWAGNKTSFVKVINRYIAIRELEKDAIWVGYFLLTYYYTNHNNKTFRSLWNKQEKQLKKSQSDSELRKLQEFLIYKIKVGANKEDRSNKKYLPYAEKALDEFYILEKLRIVCEQGNFKEITGKKTETSPVEFSEEYISKLRNKEINLYYKILQLLQNQSNDNLYIDAKDYLMDVHNEISKDILKEAYDYLTNYCISKMNREGSELFSKEYQFLIKFLEKENYLIDENGLNGHHFMNFVSSTIITKDYGLATGFIAENASKLKNDLLKENVVLLANARLLLYNEQLDACHKMLVKFNGVDPKHKIILEKIYVKIYYQKENKALGSHISSFKRKLRKMPVEKPIKDNVLLFLKLTNKLSDLKSTEDLNLEGLGVLDKLWLEKMMKVKKG